MRFHDDIDPANTWVTADTHFGHDNIVRFCHRPGDGIREEGNYGLLPHEEIMLAEWRAHVPADATLLHLGDLCYKGNAVFKHLVAKELTGARKILIRGNHDKNSTRFYRDAGFQVMRPFAIHYDSEVGHGLFADVSFNHYPWSDDEEGRPISPHEWRVHGHIHNNGYTRDSYVPFLANHINVGVEQTKYRPVNLKALLDGALFGIYSETTQAQLAEARARKEAMKR